MKIDLNAVNASVRRRIEELRSANDPGFDLQIRIAEGVKQKIETAKSIRKNFMNVFPRYVDLSCSYNDVETDCIVLEYLKLHSSMVFHNSISNIYKNRSFFGQTSLYFGFLSNLSDDSKNSHIQKFSDLVMARIKSTEIDMQADDENFVEYTKEVKKIFDNSISEIDNKIMKDFELALSSYERPKYKEENVLSSNIGIKDFLKSCILDLGNNILTALKVKELERGVERLDMSENDIDACVAFSFSSTVGDHDFCSMPDSYLLSDVIGTKPFNHTENCFGDIKGSDFSIKKLNDCAMDLTDLAIRRIFASAKSHELKVKDLPEEDRLLLISFA